MTNPQSGWGRGPGVLLSIRILDGLFKTLQPTVIATASGVRFEARCRPIAHAAEQGAGALRRRLALHLVLPRDTGLRPACSSGAASPRSTGVSGSACSFGPQLGPSRHQLDHHRRWSRRSSAGPERGGVHGGDRARGDPVGRRGAARPRPRRRWACGFRPGALDASCQLPGDAGGSSRRLRTTLDLGMLKTTSLGETLAKSGLSLSCSTPPSSSTRRTSGRSLCSSRRRCGT